MKQVFTESPNIKRISFITNQGYPSCNIVGKDRVILYLWFDPNTNLHKLGELSTLSGKMSDIDEINKSYRGAKRVLKKQLTILAFFVLPKFKGEGERGYDHDVHEKINTFSDKLGFRCPMRGAGDDENTEELVGYNHEKHFSSLIDIIKETFGYEHTLQEQFKPYNLTQAVKIDQVEKTLRDYKRCLLNAHTAFGKSTIIIKEIAAMCNVGDIALVTTPIIDTLFDLLKKNERFFYGKPVKCLDDDDISKGNIEKQIDQWKKTHIVVVCVSVQNIRYKDERAETELREKFSFLTKLPLEMWVRDEYHTQYNGLVTAKVLSEIKAKYILDLTATVYKLLELYNDYETKMIIRCDNLWAILEKKRGNKDYETYPMPFIECVPFDQLLSDETRKMFSDEAEDYREKKLFEMQHGKFVRLGAIKETFKYVVDGQMWSGSRYVSKKTIIGPLNDTSLPLDKVGIVKIPEGNNGNDAKTKIKVLKKELVCLEHAVVYTADEFLIAKKKHPKSGEGVLADWLKEAKGKMVLILTHDQLGTGTDLPQASFAVMFGRINAIDPFVQFLGRLQRRFEGKEVVKMYVLAPGMSLQLSSQVFNLVKDITKNEREAREMYDCLPLTEYLGGKWKTVSYEQAVKNNDIVLRRHLEDTDAITHSLLDRFSGLDAFLSDVELDKTLKDGFVPASDKLTDGTSGKVNKPLDVSDDVDVSDEKSDVRGDEENDPQKEKRSQGKRATLAVMFRLSPLLNLVQPCKKIDDIWSTRLARAWFDEQQRGLAKKAMTYEPMKPSLDQFFLEQKKMLEGKTLQQIVLEGKVFRDEPFLLKAGTKFLPPYWVEHVLLKDVKEAKCFIVYNALNGTIPCTLQKKFPKAKIICVEAEEKDFFSFFLTKMGFEVYPWDKKDHIIVKDKNGKLIDKKDICVVMNPPYNANLDLQFIAEATRVADKIICVHPAISTISRKDTKRFVEHKKLIEGHVKSIKLFNGNPVFGIGLFYPCEIIDIDMGKTFKEIEVVYAMDSDKTETHTFKSLFDVTKWGNVPAYFSLEKKILDWCEKNDNVENHREKEEGKWFVNVAGIRGNHGNDVMFKDDFFTFVTRNDVASRDKGKHIFFSFKTKEEAEHFIAYLKTSFARFCLAILKQNHHLNRGELAGVPYLPFYKEAWTDEKLYAFFKVSKAEQAFIKKVIPSYY